MFTGIIQQLGTVVALSPRGGDVRLNIDVGSLPAERLAPGASVAVNGVCLTVAAREQHAVAFDVSRETLAVTTLERLVAGSRVNLEPALLLSEALGGHLVSGHVDGIGEVAAIRPDGRSTRITFRLPPALMRYVAKKGSLCVDGTSLTVNEVAVNEVAGSEAGVNIVPHTLQHTIMGDYQPGTLVNIEVDLIARYLERLVSGQNTAQDLPA